jgi:cell division protein ZapA
MAVVDVTVNGRHYQVACDDGQEPHLLELARLIDGRISELARDMGQVGDARLILMAGLLIADELADAKEEVRTLKEALDTARRAGAESAQESLDSVAKRIERIAARLESA